MEFPSIRSPGSIRYSLCTETGDWTQELHAVKVDRSSALGAPDGGQGQAQDSA